MNKDRRERIAVIVDALEDIKAEESEARDNIPENMQNGERYQAMDTAVDNLDEAISSLNSVVES